MANSSKDKDAKPWNCHLARESRLPKHVATFVRLHCTSLSKGETNDAQQQKLFELLYVQAFSLSFWLAFLHICVYISATE